MLIRKTEFFRNIYSSLQSTETCCEYSSLINFITYVLSFNAIVFKISYHRIEEEKFCALVLTRRVWAPLCSNRAAIVVYSMIRISMFRHSMESSVFLFHTCQSIFCFLVVFDELAVLVWKHVVLLYHPAVHSFWFVVLALQLSRNNKFVKRSLQDAQRVQYISFSLFWPRCQQESYPGSEFWLKWKEQGYFE